MATNPYDLTDEECATLMIALDEMDYEVRDRDADFIESNLGRTGRFSEGQKRWCADMIDRYDEYLEPGWREWYKPQPRRPEPVKHIVEDETLGEAL